MNLKRSLILLFFTFLSFTVIAQNKEGEQILEEGKRLYRLEKAAWISTDHLKENFSGSWDGLDGYVTYEEAGEVVALFYQKEPQLRILIRYHFSFQPAPLLERVDTLNQLPTFYEEELIRLRERAVEEVYEKSEGFFAFYENTSFNFIPLIQNGKKQVYILTGPQVTDIVVLGNDYLLTFNKKNKLKSKKKLHNSIIALPYRGEEGEAIEQTVHSHVVSDFIDVTDICTLLLYKDYVDWKQHTVISKKYVSFFNLEEESLAVLTRKAWDRIMEMDK